MKWISPVSYDSETMSVVLRHSLEELDYIFTRESDRKHYAQFLIVMPMGRSAYVFRFRVEYPVHFVVDCYNTTPAHSGKMPFMEIKDFEHDAIPYIRKLLIRVSEYLERDPWKFTWRQRLNHGFLLPEYRRARKAWKSLGITPESIKRPGTAEAPETKPHAAADDNATDLTTERTEEHRDDDDDDDHADADSNADDDTELPETKPRAAAADDDDEGTEPVKTAPRAAAEKQEGRP